MLVSPSVASSDLLRLADEIDFIDKYFDNIHLDIADGNAVNAIDLSFKACKKIVEYSKSKEKTIHVEVMRPIFFLPKLKEMDVDVVFLQTDCHEKPLEILKAYKEAGIPLGVNISNLDMDKDYLQEAVDMTNNIPINTSHHDDPTQACDMDMLAYAIKLADEGKKVWIDGGVTYELYEQIKNSKIHAAVMGRAVFGDKKLAIERFCK